MRLWGVGGRFVAGDPPSPNFEPKISQKEARMVQKEGWGRQGVGVWIRVGRGQLWASWVPPFTVGNNISKEGVAVGNGKE